MTLKNLTSNVYNHHQYKCISSVPIAAINEVVDSKVGNGNYTNTSCGNDIPSNKDIALFHREEIQVGKLLGKGTFANVLEVSTIKLNHHQSRHHHHHCHHDHLSSSSISMTSSLTTTEHNTHKARQSISSETKTAITTTTTKTTTTKNKKGNKRYALKQIRKSILNSNDCADFAYAVATLAMEAALLSSLDHENIVTIRGLPIDGTFALTKTGRHTSYFILMDRLSDTLDQKILFWESLKRQQQQQRQQKQGGKQLQRQRIAANTNNNNNNNKGPTLALKINFALQIAKALSYLHERRIIFRDLKPQNVGFKDDHHIQLFDFGLCRKLPSIGGGGEGSNHATDDICFHMSILGTLRYISPEVLLSSYYNVKADVYSWAMVFYEMITLTKPYLECDEESHEKRVCKNGERPALQHLQLPAEIRKLLQCAWSQNSSDRMSMKQICQECITISSKMNHSTTAAANDNNNNNNIRPEDDLMTEKCHQRQQNQKKECQRNDGIIPVTTRCNLFPFFRFT